MSRYFLGSVGKAEAFRRNSAGNLELAFVSKTLTDSGLNISTTKDDIRAGEGAPVQFSFYHDSNVEITLTDVLWKKEYLEAQLGANFELGAEDYVTEDVTFAGGVGQLVGTPLPLPVSCAEGEQKLAWATKKGEDDWKLVLVEGKQVTLEGASGEYCVRYLGTVSNAYEAEINATIIPQELFLIITAPLFAGDACSASNGRAAGHITFEIPRFQLNGSQDFAMNMSQNQTMSLAGIALAAPAMDCEANGGRLLRIIEVIKDQDWKNEISGLVADDECLYQGKAPVIYGMLKGSDKIMRIPNSALTFAPVLSNGVFAAEGSEVITLKDGVAITVTIAE